AVTITSIGPHPVNLRDSRMLTRIDQTELDKIIARHELFRKARTGGARAALSHHDLSHLSLRGHDLSHGDFTGCSFFESDLSHATFDYCQFYAADLRRANARQASMVRADLRGACLRGASLTNADLTDADLREGSFASYDPKKGLSFGNKTEAAKES